MTATILRRAAAGAALATLLLGTGTAHATLPVDPDADRLHALTAELRCLVCQNESLADSTAPLALDLKREIRARMAAGDSDAQITTFLVERYGDFVTYRPPWSARTLLLWLGPLGLLGLGGALLWRHLRADTAAEDPA